LANIKKAPQSGAFVVERNNGSHHSNGTNIHPQAGAVFGVHSRLYPG